MKKLDLHPGASDLGHTIMLLEKNNTHRWGKVLLDEHGGTAQCINCELRVFYEPGDLVTRNVRTFKNKWITVGQGFTPPICEDFKNKPAKSEEDGGWVTKEDWHWLIHKS